MLLKWRPSQGHAPRPPIPVDWLVLHYTWGQYPGDYETLAKSEPPGYPSAHFYLRKNGDLYFMVKLTEMAFHAGINKTLAPERARELTPNERSVGIEIESKGTFTEAQYKALEWVIPLICFRFNIPIMTLPDPYKGCNPRYSEPYDISTLKRFSGILAHGAIHKSKVDPGMDFDWPRIQKIPYLPYGPLDFPETVIWKGDPTQLPTAGAEYE